MKVAVILCCVVLMIYAVEGESESNGPEIAKKRSTETVQVEDCNYAESRVAACENEGICKKIDWGEGLRKHKICKCTRMYYGHTCNRRSVPNVG